MITNIRRQLESLAAEAYFTRQPNELTGSLSNSLRIARAVEARANCAHPKTTENIETTGRRYRVTSCVTCETVISREEI